VAAMRYMKSANPISLGVLLFLTHIAINSSMRDSLVYMRICSFLCVCVCVCLFFGVLLLSSLSVRHLQNGFSHSSLGEWFVLFYMSFFCLGSPIAFTSISGCRVSTS